MKRFIVSKKISRKDLLNDKPDPNFLSKVAVINEYGELSGDETASYTGS